MTDVFTGQTHLQTEAVAFQSLQIGGRFQTELGLANRISLADDALLENVPRIQETNGIEKVAELQGGNFPAGWRP